MIRERSGDSPSRASVVDRECVIANYHLIGLRNVYMFVHGANRHGMIRASAQQRGIRRMWNRATSVPHTLRSRELHYLNNTETSTLKQLR
jgi:hypothetical protein